MELSPKQRLQVRLLVAGAVLIVFLFGLFIYLSIKYPETKESTAQEQAILHETANHEVDAEALATATLHGYYHTRVEKYGEEMTPIDATCEEFIVAPSNELLWVKLAERVRAGNTVNHIDAQSGALIMNIDTSELDASLKAKIVQSSSGTLISLSFRERPSYGKGASPCTPFVDILGEGNKQQTDYQEGEYIDVIGEVREYGADAGGGDVAHYMYTFLIPARDTTAHQYEMVRIDNDVSCVEASLYRGHPQVHIRGIIEQVVPNFALIMSCRTKGTSVTRVTTGPCWASGNAVRESYRIADGKVYCGDEFMRDADAATFSLLPGTLGDEVGVGVSGLARDMDTVFVDTRALPNADVASFQLIGGNYARDSEHVYYHDGEVRVVVGADPSTFTAYTADTDTYLRLYDSTLDPGFASDKYRNYKAGEAYSGVMPSYVFEQ